MAVTDCSTELADQLNVCCSLSIIKPRLHVVRNAALMTIFELSVLTYVSSLELTMAFPNMQGVSTTDCKKRTPTLQVLHFCHAITAELLCQNQIPASDFLQQ